MQNWALQYPYQVLKQIIQHILKKIQRFGVCTQVETMLTFTKHSDHYLHFYFYGMPILSLCKYLFIWISKFQ